jgi:hypothetical protein
VREPDRSRRDGAECETARSLIRFLVGIFQTLHERSRSSPIRGGNFRYRAGSGDPFEHNLFLRPRGGPRDRLRAAFKSFETGHFQVLALPEEPESVGLWPLDSLGMDNQSKGPYYISGVMLDRGPEAEPAILADELRRYSGRIEKDGQYDKRTVFGCTPGGCPSGGNCACSSFDFP